MSSSSKDLLGPTPSLFVSIRHDLYFVCKAASVRSDLLQALNKLSLVSVRLYRSGSYLLQSLIQVIL
jgi:hypothetical protein